MAPDAVAGLPPSRVALVTGASRGIGAAIAEGLARHGLAVGLLGRDRERLAASAAACRQAGAAAVPVVADVTDADQVAAALDTVAEAAGPVDLVVNAAGRIEAAEVPYGAADLADLWGVVEVDLRGPMVVTRVALPGLLARGGGRVLNLGSGFGHREYPAYPAYSVAKAALSRFTAVLAEQHGGDGLVVLEASPGLVRTRMTEGMPMWADAPASAWTPVSRVVDLARDLAAGRLDVLSGRFVHAGRDDWRALAAAAAGWGPHARRLRLAPYGAGDPLDPGFA